MLDENGLITEAEFMQKLSMANDNATDWSMDTTIAVETVKATIAFLRSKEHQGSSRKINMAQAIVKTLESQDSKSAGRIREAITRFLGGVFNDGLIHRALSIIHAIDDKTVAERARYQAMVGKMR